MTPHISTTLLRTQSDERLVRLAAGGHERAFEAIVERYRRPLTRFAQRFVGEARAEEVVQTAFLNAWNSLRSGTEVRDLKPWLYRIVNNGAINALQRADYGDAPLIEASDFRMGPEAAYEQSEELRLTVENISGLPERQREALLAVAVDGRAHADHWARGWEAFYAIATVTSAGWAVTRDVPVQRTDALVGAAKSALGGATHLTMITFSAERGAADVRALPRDTPAARRHALAVAEAALRTNARDAGQRTFWLRHLGTVLVNVAGGLIVGLAHHDWKTAGISTAVGIGTGEAAIWSQPWRAPSDWRDYEARFGPGSN